MSALPTRTDVESVFFLNDLISPKSGSKTALQNFRLPGNDEQLHFSKLTSIPKMMVWKR